MVAMPVPEAEPGWFHAVALDYDGTLTHGPRPAPAVLEALAATRARGCSVVLVTGRILAELRDDFPDVDRHVDLVVGENGAVLSRNGIDRALTAPVPATLSVRLRDRGIPHRVGAVLIASHAAHENEILAEIRRLGLECQLIRNRGELMVLPTGISKGSGLFEGLGDLGISRHNTVAVGDAENDHSLLDVAELGVAVGNAIPALKERADLVLDRSDGEGVVDLLDGPVLAGRQLVRPGRWNIELGSTATGEPVALPASQLNLLVAGAPQTGKSYLTGLIAERLLGHGYTLLVIDPEGDHVGLGELRGVLIVGRGTAPPPPDGLTELLRHRFASVVVDLSSLSLEQRRTYAAAALTAVAPARRRTGLPHWVIVDEAQDVFRTGSSVSALPGAGTGYCLATHRPDVMASEVIDAIDGIVLAPQSDAVVAESLLRSGGVTGAIGAIGVEAAVVVERRTGRVGSSFEPGQRTTTHLRHWHKYELGGLDTYRRFHFRSSWDQVTGATAGSVVEFTDELRGATSSVLVHHSRHHDFSRWFAEVIGDRPLAARLEEVEDRLATGHLEPEDGRGEFLTAIRSRCPW